MVEKKWFQGLLPVGTMFAYWAESSHDDEVESISFGMITPHGWQWSKIADSGKVNLDAALSVFNADEQTVKVLGRLWTDAPSNGKNIVLPDGQGKFR